MPSTFTNNGGIELPADGEKDGVWGDVVNLNMQIVDRLTNGVGAVSLSGTTSTLVTSDGSLSGDGQYKVLVFGGSPSGTHTVTIQPDDAQKIYFVKNETAEDVVMAQGSGGNATIAAGSGAIVYADGVGTGSAVVDLTAVFVPDLAQAGVTASIADLNLLDGATLELSAITASAAELNLLDGVPLTADLSYVDGVTSAIQTQIDAKQATITGAATTIASSDLTASRALVSDGSGKVAVSTVTTAELATITSKANDTDASIADSISLTGAASDWKFSLSGNNLIISYGATSLAKLDTSGNLTVAGDITAFGTVT